LLKGFTLLVLVAALPLCSAFAQTDIYLRTERTGRGKIPIVVKNIDPSSARMRRLAEYITSVLSKDLGFTGVFDPLEFEGEGDVTAGGRTAAAVFEGRLMTEYDEYQLQANLLDFSSKEVIFNKLYTFKEDASRTVAHHLCDEILFFLVGERGIATTRLLFCRREGDSKDLYVIDYDGYNEKRLSNSEIVVSPLWLDEKRFCYTSYKRGNPDCYLVDLKEGIRRLISHRRGTNIAGSYFAHRDEIAVTLSVKGNSEVYVIDSSGGIVRRLTRNRAIDCSPTWAPNGNELAFVSDRTGSPQIYSMDKFGGNLRRLSTKGAYNTSPAWSPEGDLIAYVSREGWLYRLKLISPDGFVEETLFEDYLSYEDPDWAPNGRHLAATVRYGGRPWIVIINVETGDKRRLVQGELPSWSPLPVETAGES
jgi:TolB protein